MKNYPLILLLSSGMIFFPHILFLLNIGGPIFPLVILGIAYGLFGVAFWPAVAYCITSPKPSSSEQLLGPRMATEEAESDIQPDGESTGVPSDNLAPGHRPPQNDDLVLIGYGIMTTLMNMTMALVPVLLAAMETVAEDTGLELVFVALSTVGAIALVKLSRAWRG
jgi:hypothetical protein